MAVVGAVVSAPGERADLLSGRLVDPARRGPAPVAMDEAGRTLVAEPALEPPDRPDREPRSSAASATSTSPAITFVNTHARRCSIVVIVIVSLMTGRLTKSLISWN